MPCPVLSPERCPCTQPSCSAHRAPPTPRAQPPSICTWRAPPFHPVFCSSVTQSRRTLCNPKDCSPPGFSVLHHLPCYSGAKPCPTPWMAVHQAPLSSTTPQTLVKLMSIESVMLSNHLILLPPSLSSLNLSQHQGSPVSQLFSSGGQSTGASASASVLPVNS